MLSDDDSFQLEMISGILEGLGLTDTTQSSSGEYALQKLSAEKRFNLMLSDLHMPGVDGFKFMESLGEVGFNGALIIVPGQTDDVMHAASIVPELRRFTLLGTVPKPVSRAALSALISKPV